MVETDNGSEIVTGEVELSPLMLDPHTGTVQHKHWKDRLIRRSFGWDSDGRSHNTLPRVEIKNSGGKVYLLFTF
jgi:hypothetical protein